MFAQLKAEDDRIDPNKLTVSEYQVRVKNYN